MVGIDQFLEQAVGFSNKTKVTCQRPALDFISPDKIKALDLAESHFALMIREQVLNGSAEKSLKIARETYIKTLFEAIPMDDRICAPTSVHNRHVDQLCLEFERRINTLITSEPSALLGFAGSRQQHGIVNSSQYNG